jgi:hypothetical protein
MPDRGEGHAPGSCNLPAIWALMLAGFGLVGGTLRSHRTATFSFG